MSGVSEPGGCAHRPTCAAACCGHATQVPRQVQPHRHAWSAPPYVQPHRHEVPRVQPSPLGAPYAAIAIHAVMTSGSYQRRCNVSLLFFALATGGWREMQQQPRPRADTPVVGCGPDLARWGPAHAGWGAGITPTSGGTPGECRVCRCEQQCACVCVRALMWWAYVLCGCGHGCVCALLWWVYVSCGLGMGVCARLCGGYMCPVGVGMGVRA